MMHTAYNRLFWGVVIVFAHLRINGWDLLPDVIGWGLVLHSLKLLADQHPGFRKARNAAFPLFLCSFLTLFHWQSMPFFENGFSLGDLLLTLAMQVFSILMLYFVHWVCWAIADLSSRRQLPDAATAARTCWRFALAAWSIQLALTPVQLHLPENAVWLITACWAVLMVTAMVMMLRMLWIARKKLAHSPSLD